MTDEDIKKRATEIAHKHTKTCSMPWPLSRGAACLKLATAIAAAMREAMDGFNFTESFRKTLGRFDNLSEASKVDYYRGQEKKNERGDK